MPGPKIGMMTLLPQSGSISIGMCDNQFPYLIREKSRKKSKELSRGNVGPGSPPLNG